MSDPHLSETIFGEGGSHASGVEEVPRRRRNRGPIGCVVTLLVVLAVAAAAVFSAGQLKPVVSKFFGGAPDYSASDVSGQKASVTIAAGQSASQIGDMLQKDDVVKSSQAFVEAARANDKWTSMQPGTYEIAKHSPAADVVAWIVDPKHKVTTLVTIREGLRKWEVYALLAEKTGHDVSEYEAAEKQATALGLPAAAKGDIEGWLFPSSYEFSKKTSAADQIKTMIAKAVQTTSALGIPADQLEETVIKASIVESEGRRDEDRAKIARVLDNRLAAGMMLQLDSTVVYPLHKRVLATSEADRKLRNGYNTYAMKGLPQGPIANPGEVSLKAAANPAPGPWLYFVTVNPVTGETKFATTLSEHEKYVAEWRAFCKANPGSC